MNVKYVRNKYEFVYSKSNAHQAYILQQYNIPKVIRNKYNAIYGDSIKFS